MRVLVTAVHVTDVHRAYVLLPSAGAARCRHRARAGPVHPGTEHRLGAGLPGDPRARLGPGDTCALRARAPRRQLVADDGCARRGARVPPSQGARRHHLPRGADPGRPRPALPVDDTVGNILSIHTA
uniref:Uncharacterized protein n=1 Tax=Janibacter limosus TaxID=53458 RepID=A0AC61U972_9MICO|nr:hypothetical protein [Janibacter limosus]